MAQVKQNAFVTGIKKFAKDNAGNKPLLAGSAVGVVAFFTVSGIIVPALLAGVAAVSVSGKK